MSQDQQIEANNNKMADVVNGTPMDEQNVEDEKLNLFVLLGQTSSVEEIKSLLNQLNSSKFPSRSTLLSLLFFS